MNAHDLRARRLALGYGVNLMAEILRVPPDTLLDWETGRAEIDDPEWLTAALQALVTSHASASPVCELVILD
jgi:DNA-binding transcriptional regulator YiaG